MKYLVNILVVLLIGCASPEARVVKLPEPPIIEVPILPIKSITKTSTTKEIVEAYYSSIIILQGALDQAINALSVYRGNTHAP